MGNMQTLKRWKFKLLPPSDVPPGHVGVRVGSGCQRFVVPVAYLNHPVFAKLLEEAAKQYGFDGNEGPIHIPCDESKFQEALRVVTRSANLPPIHCRVATESKPKPKHLLHFHGVLLLAQYL